MKKGRTSAGVQGQCTGTAAGFPENAQFTTKPRLAGEMVAAAPGAGIRYVGLRSHCWRAAKSSCAVSMASGVGSDTCCHRGAKPEQDDAGRHTEPPQDRGP